MPALAYPIAIGRSEFQGPTYQPLAAARSACARRMLFHRLQRSIVFEITATLIFLEKLPPRCVGAPLGGDMTILQRPIDVVLLDFRNEGWSDHQRGAKQQFLQAAR